MANCQYCGKEFSERGLANHEKACTENPLNKVEETEMEDTTKETEGTTAQETEATQEAPMTDGQIDRVTRSFADRLKEEEHVDIFIPPTQLYPDGSNLPICLNGVTYTIPVGIQFDKGVPKSIHAVWKESYNSDKLARDKMKKALTGVISIG